MFRLCVVEVSLWLCGLCVSGCVFVVVFAVMCLWLCVVVVRCGCVLWMCLCGCAFVILSYYLCIVVFVVVCCGCVLWFCAVFVCCGCVFVAVCL